MSAPEQVHPWPYPDIPRPPLLAGVELVSVPEAVGILGARLYPDPDNWPKPPESWREKWAPLRLGQPLAREEREPPQELRDDDGSVIGSVGRVRRVELPEETSRARKLLFELDDPHDPEVADKPPRAPLFWILQLLLATGGIRSVASWKAAGDEGGPGLVRRHAEPDPDWWGRIAMARGLAWGELTASFKELCWTSLLTTGGGGSHRHFRIYLPRAEVKAIGPKEAAEVMKRAGGRPPGSTWLATVKIDLATLEDDDELPLRRENGQLKGPRECAQELVDNSSNLRGRYGWTDDGKLTVDGNPVTLDWFSRQALKPLRAVERISSRE